MIRYKAVTRNRKSLIVEGKYELTYKKGSVVKAMKNTLGIMCFKTEETAIAYMADVGHLHPLGPRIIEVMTKGKGSRPPLMSIFTNDKDLDGFYSIGITISTAAPPKGTVCYQQVKVLT